MRPRGIGSSPKLRALVVSITVAAFFAPQAGAATKATKKPTSKKAVKVTTTVKRQAAAGSVVTTPATTPATVPPADRGGTVTYGLSSEPATMDPKLNQGGSSNGAFPYAAVYDSLAFVDTNTGNIVPRLAEQIYANADRTVWTIKLRPNLKFSDGTVFDAAAIGSNWDRMLNPANGSTLRSTLATFKDWRADGLTFTVTLTKPRGSFPLLLAQGLGAVPSPAATQKYGANYGSSPETTVGAGPFILKEWVRNSSLTLVKNPNYYQPGKPAIDRLIMRTIPDAGQKADALATKTIDIGFFNTLDANTKRISDAGYNVDTTQSFVAPGARFNLSRPPLDDIRIRRALILAADPVDINQKATGGFAPVAGGPGSAYYPKGSPFYDATVTQQTNDLAAAQKLIDEYIAAKGPIPTIKVMIPNVTTPLGTAVVQSFSRLKGINVEADVMPASQAITNLNTGNYQVAAVSTYGWSYPDEALPELGTGQATNVIKYSNPKFDKIIDGAFGDTDLSLRSVALNDLARTGLDDALWLRVYYITFTHAYGNNLKGSMKYITLFGYPDPAEFALK